MKRALVAVLLLGVLVLGVAALPGCGSMTTMSTTTVKAAATTLVDQAALEKYGKEIAAWRDKYKPKLEATIGALNISDVSNASDAQIKGVEEFQTVMDDRVAALKSIRAPDNLRSAHSAYAAGLERIALGVGQYVDALKKKSASRAQDAYATITSTSSDASMGTARTTLESWLLLTLPSN